MSGMNTYAVLPAPRRAMTPDQMALGAWIGALMSSGRGPSSATKLCHALIDAGVRNPSYETIVKAARGEVTMPAKYCEGIARVYALIDGEAAGFSLVVALAHMAPEAAHLYRSANKLPASLPIPDLKVA